MTAIDIVTVGKVMTIKRAIKKITKELIPKLKQVILRVLTLKQKNLKFFCFLVHQYHLRQL